MKRILLYTLLILLLPSFPKAYSQESAVAAFINAPKKIFPTISKNTRLDMIDYFRNGSATASKNFFDGDCRVLEEKNNHLLVQISDAYQCQIDVIPFGGGDSIIVVINTLETPVPDSNIEFYNLQWEKINKKLFSAPLLKEWLSPEGSSRIDEVENMVPFLLVSYSFDGETKILTLTNNMGSYFSKEDWETLGPCLLNEVQYVWTGKKMNKLK